MWGCDSIHMARRGPSAGSYKYPDGDLANRFFGNVGTASKKITIWTMVAVQNFVSNTWSVFLSSIYLEEIYQKDKNLCHQQSRYTI
jgi:hypothetical protein